ncbi:unnamed protein product, partial [Scytosiphon promiscuus]
MKSTIYKLIFPLSLLMLFSQCSDDYLTEEPRSFLSPVVTYDTDDGLASGAVGLYDELSYPYFNSSTWRNCWTITNGATD